MKIKFSRFFTIDSLIFLLVLLIFGYLGYVIKTKHPELIQRTWERFTQFTDETKLRPEVSYQGSWDEYAVEARLWCSDNPHRIGVLPSLVHFSDMQRACDNLPTWTTAELRDYDAQVVMTEIVPEMLTRLDKFNANITCNLDLNSLPIRDKDLLYNEDISIVLNWEKQEFARINDCIKSLMKNESTRAWTFIDTLFADISHPITSSALTRRRSAVNNSAFDAPLNELFNQIQIAARASYVDNVKKWNIYAQRTLKPKLKAGRAIDRQIEKEMALEAYTKEHDYGPNEMCVYDDGKGRRQYRCVEGLPQDRSTSPLEGFFEQYIHLQQQRDEKAKIEQDAYFNYLQLQSESRVASSTQKMSTANKTNPKTVETSKKPDDSDCPKGIYFGEKVEVHDRPGTFTRKRTTDPSITGMCDHQIK